MSISGTLILTDNGQERRLECSGDLESFKLESTGELVRGKLHVPDEAIGPLQDAMREQANGGEDALVRYSGEVYEQGRDGKRVVTDLPLMVRGMDGANDVTFETKGT